MNDTIKFKIAAGVLALSFLSSSAVISAQEPPKDPMMFVNMYDRCMITVAVQEYETEKNDELIYNHAIERCDGIYKMFIYAIKDTITE